MKAHQLKLLEATTEENFKSRVSLILDEISAEYIANGIITDRDNLGYHVILDRINEALGTSINRYYLERECWDISKRIDQLWWKVTLKIKLDSLEGSKNLDGKKMSMMDLFKAISPVRGDRERHSFYTVLCEDRELFSQFQHIRCKQWAGDDEINQRGHQLIDEYEQWLDTLRTSHGPRKYGDIMPFAKLARELGFAPSTLKRSYPELALRCMIPNQIEYHNTLTAKLRELLEEHKRTKMFCIEGGRFVLSAKVITKHLDRLVGLVPEFYLALYARPDAVDAYIDLVLEVSKTDHDQLRKEAQKLIQKYRVNGESLTIYKVEDELKIGVESLRRRYPEIYEIVKLEMSNSKTDPRSAWYFDQMGYNQGQLPLSRSVRLSWKQTKQDWLLKGAQSWIKEQMRKKYAASTIQTNLTITNHLSSFLEKHNINRPEDVSRELMETYLLDLSEYRNQGNRVGTLRSFFEHCRKKKILNFKEDLLFLDDAVYNAKDWNATRFIPDSVMDQLIEVIPKMKNEVYERFWSIMLDTGKRYGEIINCEYDCLKEVQVQDQSGNWVTEYNFRVKQYKMKSYSTVPIDETIVKLIRMQQDWVNKEFPNGSKWLFPTPIHNMSGSRNTRVGTPMNGQTVKRAFDKVIKAHNVIDENGLPFKLRTHDFRHTFANTCLRGEMSIITLQKLLGHKSPVMSLWYAKLNDDQNRQEWQQHYQSRLVSITGETVTTNWLNDLSEDELDVEWLRHNIKAQTLPNGLCALPKKLGDCPHANACLTCTHFRTDYTFLDVHKEQLARTNKIVAEAKKNGWHRHEEMNTKIQKNLTNIINSIEKDPNDNVSA
jgi:integrase